MADNVLVYVLVPLSLVCLIVVFIIVCLCCKRYRQTESGNQSYPDVPATEPYDPYAIYELYGAGPGHICVAGRRPPIEDKSFYCEYGDIPRPRPSYNGGYFSLYEPRAANYHIEEQIDITDTGPAATWSGDLGPATPDTPPSHIFGGDSLPNEPRAANYHIEEPSGPANDDTQSLANDPLVDYDLHELMVPDMNESVVREVRSKPIVFISKRIDQMGGTLVLNNMGISLTVPPGAIEPGKPEIIFLALIWDLRDLPRMTPNQTIVSPVVQVGPHGLKLKRQATLSFRHCAFDSNQVKVYSSETHLMQDKEWSAMEGDEEGETSSHLVLDKECQVYLSHFTLFTCIAEGEAVKKWLQIVAFGKMIGSQYEIRIYLLNGNPSALHFAVENEKKFHFEQMKGPREYLFCDDMTNMILKVESISEGWSSNVGEMQEEIPFLSIWHGKSPYASFVFKMLNRETEEINTTISARQGDGSKLQLKLLKEIRQKQREDIDSGNKGFVQELVSEDYVPRGHEALQMASPPVIPHKLKMKLVELMDPHKAAGNDWRMIASELGVDSKIDFLGMQKSPFLEVLGIMQGMTKDLGWLKEMLILHERIDAVDVITQYLETTGGD